MPSRSWRDRCRMGNISSPTMGELISSCASMTTPTVPSTEFSMGTMLSAQEPSSTARATHSMSSMKISFAPGDHFFAAISENVPSGPSKPSFIKI